MGRPSSTPTTIRALEWQPLTLSLVEPFGIAGGSHDVARNVLVTVTLADGTRGYGEAAPLPPYNGETQESVLAAMPAARAVVEGGDVRAHRAIALALARAIPDSGAARCAIETAVLDALTKRASMPLWAFFGGAATSLVTDVTIPTGDVATARASAARWHAQGFTVLKIKVGASSVEEDLARVLAVRDVAPGARLTLDANAGLDATRALALLVGLEDAGVRVDPFEQPVAKDDLAGLLEVGAHVAVAADESVTSAGEALRVFDGAHAPLRGSRAGAVPHAINVKLMKAGIAAALDVVAVARARGLRLMIGGMVESVLAMTTSACFAAGLGGFDLVDLDTALFIADDAFTGGFAQRGPHLDLSGIAAGHGVVPR